MSCQEIAPLLLARAVDALEPGEEKELAAHLASCKECPALEAERALHGAFTHAHRRAPEGRAVPVAAPLRAKAPLWPYTLAAGIALFAMALPAAFRRTHQQNGPLDVVFPTACGVNEVRVYEDLLDEKDPPLVTPETPLDGTAVDFLSAEDPNVAHVEWAIPDRRDKATFLVRGLSTGDAVFSLRFRSGRERRYHVRIEGVSPHEQLRKARLDRLATLSADDLKKEIHEHIRRGEELETAVQKPRGEQRQAWRHYERAEEALYQLVKTIDKLGVADPDLEVERASVKQHLERAKDAWRETLARARQDYAELTRRKQWDVAAKELEGLIGLIGLMGDDCELDSQRWRLLHEKVFMLNGHGARLPAPRCSERD